MPERPSIAFAVVGSLVLHLVIALVIALLIVVGPLFAIAVPSPPQPEPAEITIAMPDVLIPEEEEEEPPPEDDVLDPVVPENADMGDRELFRTTQNEREDEAPENARFESDRNTTAASEAPADPDAEEADMPSQDGEDVPFLELQAREYVDGELADDATKGDEGPEDPSPPSPPVPSVAESAPQAPSPLAPTEEPAEPVDADGESDTEESPEDPAEGDALVARATPPPMAEPIMELPFDPASATVELPDLEPGDERIEDPLTIREPMLDEVLEEASPAAQRVEEMVIAETPPPMQPPSEPRPLPGDPEVEETDVFQPHTPKTHYRGGIGQRGRAAVNAADTPLGRYGKAVTQAIERTWHLYRMNHSDFVTYATIRLRFQVNQQGKPENLQIIQNDANAIMTDFTLNAVLDANIPPIPPEVVDLLDEGKFNLTYDVIVY